MDRRGFLRTGFAATAFLLAAGGCQELSANPYGLDIGLQLYTVRNDLQRDFAGTIGKVAAIGYGLVELAGPYSQSPSEIKFLIRSNGMLCPSAHIGYPELASGLERQIGYAKEIGLRYIVLPSLPSWMRRSRDSLKQAVDFLNKTGERLRKADLYFAYHNHATDFSPIEGTSTYDQLLGGTDPELVYFELDCFWAKRAGYDPVDLLNAYPGRFPLLHIKDEKKGYPPTTLGRTPAAAFTEVGKGTIDWKRVFETAHRDGLKHYFVEQDQCDVPELRAAQMSYEYLHQLTV